MESLAGYLTKLASDAPAPGGGSAAMVVGAAACALVAMAARICAGSKKYAAVHETANDLARRADALREQMLTLREQDERAFEAVVAAKGDREQMQRALAGAAEAPMRGAHAALDALRLAADALALGNANLISDVGCAGEFAHAALVACAYNVRINHKFMDDEATITRQQGELRHCEAAADLLVTTIREALRRELG